MSHTYLFTILQCMWAWNNHYFDTKPIRSKVNVTRWHHAVAVQYIWIPLYHWYASQLPLRFPEELPPLQLIHSNFPFSD